MEKLLRSAPSEDAPPRSREKEIEEEERLNLITQLYCVARRCAEIRTQRNRRKRLSPSGPTCKEKVWEFWLSRSLEERAEIMSIAEPMIVEVLSLLATRTRAHRRIARKLRPALQVLKRTQNPRKQRAPKARPRARSRAQRHLLAAGERFTDALVPLEHSEYWHCRNIEELLTVNDRLVAQTLMLKQPGKKQEMMISLSLRLLQRPEEMLQTFETLSLGGFLEHLKEQAQPPECDAGWQTPQWCERMLHVTLGTLLVGLFEQRLLVAYATRGQMQPSSPPRVCVLARPRMDLLKYLNSRQQEAAHGPGRDFPKSKVAAMAAGVYATALRRWRSPEYFYESSLTSQLRRLCHESDVSEAVLFWTSAGGASEQAMVRKASLMLATLLAVSSFKGFRGIGDEQRRPLSLVESVFLPGAVPHMSEDSGVALGCVDALSGSPLSYCGTVMGSVCLQVSSKMQNDVSRWYEQELERLLADDEATAGNRVRRPLDSNAPASPLPSFREIAVDEAGKKSKKARRRRKSGRGKGKPKDPPKTEAAESSSRPSAIAALNEADLDFVPPCRNDQRKRHSTGRLSLERVAPISDTDSDEPKMIDGARTTLRYQDSVASSEDDEDLSRLVASVGLHVPERLDRGRRRGRPTPGPSLRLSKSGNCLSIRQDLSFALEGALSCEETAPDDLTEADASFGSQDWEPIDDDETAVQDAREAELEQEETPAVGVRNSSPGARNRARTNSEGDTVSDYLIMDFDQDGPVDGRADPNANLLNAMDLSTKRNAGGAARKAIAPIKVCFEVDTKESGDALNPPLLPMRHAEGSREARGSLAVSSSSGTDSPASEEEASPASSPGEGQCVIASPERLGETLETSSPDSSGNAGSPSEALKDGSPEPVTTEPELAALPTGPSKAEGPAELDRMKGLAEDNALLLDMCLRLEAEASSLRNVVALQQGHLATVALPQFQPRQIGLNYPAIPEHFVATFPSGPAPPQSPQRPSMAAMAPAAPPPPPTAAAAAAAVAAAAAANVGMNQFFVGWSPGYSPALPPAVGPLFYPNRALSDCGKAGDSLSDDLNPLAPVSQDRERADSAAAGIAVTPDHTPPSMKAAREAQRPSVPSSGGREVPNALLRSRLGSDIAAFVAYVTEEQTKNAMASAIAIENCGVVVRTLWPRAQIKAYGSFISQLHLPSSDVDLVITLPKVRTQFLAATPGALESGNAIREGEHNILARSLMHEKWVDRSTIKVISHTPIPLVKLCALIDPSSGALHGERVPSRGISTRLVRPAAVSFGGSDEPLSPAEHSFPPIPFPMYDRCTFLPRAALQLNLDGYPLRAFSRHHQAQVGAARRPSEESPMQAKVHNASEAKAAGKAKDLDSPQSTLEQQPPDTRAQLNRRSMSALGLDTDKCNAQGVSRRASSPMCKPADEGASAGMKGKSVEVGGVPAHESFAEAVKSTTVHKRRSSGTYYSTNHAPSYRGLREGGILFSTGQAAAQGDKDGEGVAPECTPSANEGPCGRPTPVRLDISFESQQHFGVRANGYMLHLIEALPPLRPLVLILKQFCKEKGLSASYTGGISSYALTLLVARYLQETIGRSGGDLGALLLGFLDFYGTRFDPRTTGVSVGRAVYFSRMHANQYMSQMNLYDPIIIEDPLCRTNNVGRNCFRIQQVLKTWRTAAQALHARLDQDADAVEGNQRIGPLENVSVLSCMIKGEIIMEDD